MYHSPDDEGALRRIAVRDFSEETADRVVEAWNQWSEGIRHTVTHNKDQYGPYRVGPSFPFLFEKEYIIPNAPYARFKGNSICKPKYPYPLETEYDYKKINHEIEYAKIALATIPLVEFDSRLGFEPSMEYMTDRERIEWKVAVTRQVMDEEVTPLLKNNLCVKG